MDWTKAKTILIAALLATNLILIVVYGFSTAESATKDQMLEGKTIALLENKGIYVKDGLPTKHNNMSVLSVEYDRLDSSILDEKMTTQTPVLEENRTKESFLDQADQFLRDCGIQTNTVVLDHIDLDGSRATITYRNDYQGVTVEDSYMICTIDEGRVTNFERFWLNPLELGRTKRATISASAALISLVGTKQAQESILVEEMELVYWLDPTNYGGENTVRDTAFPAWKVTYNGGQVIHISAYLDE